LTVVFWLTTFALLADECKWWSAEQSGLEDLKKAGNNLADLGYTGYTGYSNSWINKLLAASKSSRAATGLAAINWLLFMVTFGFVGRSHPSLHSLGSNLCSLEHADVAITSLLLE
jgi:hypothetical protein